MKRILSMWALLAVIFIGFGFLTCGSDDWVDPVRPTTDLLSLKIQPVDMLGNLPVNRPNVDALVLSNIPEPILEDDWNDMYFNVTDAEQEELWFLLEAHTETARVIAEVTPGCVVEWGIGSSGTRPLSFANPSQPLPFVNNDFIYIRVSTRDMKYSSYYRIHARLASPVTLISVISIAGRELEIEYDAGRFEWDELKEADVPELPLSIALKEGQNGANLLVTKMDDNSSVKYARVTAGTDLTTLNLSNLDFAHSETVPIYVWDPELEEDVLHMGANIVFADQDILVAQMVAQNQNDVNFYKFRVSVGRIATISKMELLGDSKNFDILAVGIPSTTWASVIAGSYGAVDQPGAKGVPGSGFGVDVLLQDQDSTWQFAIVDELTSPIPGSFNLTGKNWIDNKQHVALRIDSATKLPGGASAVVMYYKIRIDLLAAIITEQPKSTVYFIDSYNYPRTPVTIEVNGVETTYQRVLVDAVGTRTVRGGEPAALEAKLDRTLTGATYQWYTANSWYGGYGFDRHGRIVGDPDFAFDGYHPSTERGGLDEKNNVSFHNGGNSHYRLPIGYPLDMEKKEYDFENRANYSRVSGWLPYPAIKIPASEGGTNATYTPKIDASKRPFISGYSNQTQYYWVVITDSNGYQVESQRAVIVAEWGEVWEKGVPIGPKVEKKHHIVDLNKDLGLPKRNEKPFSFHREEYIIPLTLPAGFDIADYSVATAQAVFYLADGRTWIQNWTQGDIFFNVGEGNRVVGYFNLTNNNATLGLSGDSRDPQGASIWQNPTHIGIAPAGEKPPNRMPPFLEDGVTPENINDAQGWFTQYIEIVELRFEGPSRPR